MGEGWIASLSRGIVEKMLAALIASECLLLAVMLWQKRYLQTPSFAFFVLFNIISAITYDPRAVAFFSTMWTCSDIIKAGVLVECFVLAYSCQDATDHALSAAIIICAASFVTSAAYYLPNAMAAHMRTSVWLSAAALTMAWWTWRRSDRLPLWLKRHVWLLGMYFVSKAAPIVAWPFTKGHWQEINTAAELAGTLIFAAWAMAGPWRGRSLLVRIYIWMQPRPPSELSERWTKPRSQANKELQPRTSQ